MKSQSWRATNCATPGNLVVNAPERGILFKKGLYQTRFEKSIEFCGMECEV